MTIPERLTFLALETTRKATLMKQYADEFLEEAKQLSEIVTEFTKPTTPDPVPVPDPVPPVSGDRWDIIRRRTGPKKPLPAPVSSWTSTANGQIVDGLHVNGVITVKHDDVSILNFKAKGVNNIGDRLTLMDGILDGQDQVENGFTDGGIRCLRVEFTNFVDAGKALGNTHIESCWIHDLNFTGTSHNDGFQVSSGSDCSFIGNVFERSRGTAAIFCKPDFGNISDIWIEGNLFDDWGNLMLQTSKGPKGTIQRYTAKNNVFGREPAYIKQELGWKGEFYRNIQGVTSLVWENNTTLDGRIIGA